MHRNIDEQLVHFLSDMYSVELQALAQLVSAPDIAGNPRLAEDFRRHHAETERQAALVGQRLEELGGSPSAIKDAVMKVGGKAFLLFARVQPETPGRLLAHAYSYEAMEWAGYEMLWRLAERAGDEQTAQIARAVGAQERAMMQRLEDRFGEAEHASHGQTPSGDLDDELRKHLKEAHALEVQAGKLLEKSEQIAGSDELARTYRRSLSQTHEHAELIDLRLKSLNANVSLTRDAVMALGGINWGLFFQAQSDTPAKLAAFVYAFEHLEIGGYELFAPRCGASGRYGHGRAVHANYRGQAVDGGPAGGRIQCGGRGDAAGLARSAVTGGGMKSDRNGSMFDPVVERRHHARSVLAEEARCPGQ